MPVITSIKGRQILDSRGNPTLEVEVHAGDVVGAAAVPSGASTGTHEAYELRDGGNAYGGKGVTKALANLVPLAKVLKGKEVTDQQGIDDAMCALDGTPQKKRLGANALLGVSLAAARCAAASQDMGLHLYISSLSRTKPSLPLPFANVLNGGKHALGGLAIQEIMVVPTKAKSVSHATQMIAEIYQILKARIHKKFGPSCTLVGDEGGFAPPFKAVEDALDFLVDTIKEAGHEGGVSLALDSAATEFHKNGVYHLHKKMTPKQLADYYLSLLKTYPIISFEDPFAEDDFEAFAHFTKRCSVQVVGDDLLVTGYLHA